MYLLWLFCKAAYDYFGQYINSLKDVIIPPMHTGDVDDFTDIGVHGECEGSALPLIMRKLVEK